MTSKIWEEVSLGMLDFHSPVPYVFWGFSDSTCLDYKQYNARYLLHLKGEKKKKRCKMCPCGASKNNIVKAKQPNGIKYRTKTNKL